MNVPLIIIGAGGHARVLISVLKILDMNILGVTDLVMENNISGMPMLGHDEIIFNYSPESVLLVNGVGSVETTGKRAALYNKFKQCGYSFASVIHPSALIVDGVKLGEGVHIMAGVVIQAGCEIGDNSIVNTGAVIDHDCTIGNHVHIAPGVVLSGGVNVGTMVHVGTGATIIQGIEINEGAIVGAGSVVIRNVPRGVKVVGVPAGIKESYERL